MNRRTFLEAATKSMACAGTAMFLTGKSLQQTEPEIPPVQRSVKEGEYETWLWHVKSESRDHAWYELRDTAVYPNGEVFTRITCMGGAFTKTTVTPDCYPAWTTRMELAPNWDPVWGSRIISKWA